MVKCCVVYCTSGYKSNPEKVSQFRVPKNPILREKWVKAIARKDFVFNDRTFVCSKHFKEEDIIRTWHSGSEDMLLIKVGEYYNITQAYLGICCIIKTLC